MHPTGLAEKTNLLSESGLAQSFRESVGSRQMVGVDISSVKNTQHQASAWQIRKRKSSYSDQLLSSLSGRNSIKQTQARSVRKKMQTAATKTAARERYWSMRENALLRQRKALVETANHIGLASEHH